MSRQGRLARSARIRWSGIFTPLMRLGEFSQIHGGLDGAPPALLRAADSYCEVRICNFAQRTANHRAKSAIKIYAKWRGHIRRELGEQAG